ncbi:MULTISPECIES: hypothetical protein [unclassified Streptomyces]|uniref:hypothetical protein n=1 Tax=unclassified Streptomyces TaxID=2593676 RepID=UPI003321CA8E
MNAASFTPVPASPVRGSTALGIAAPPHPRHLLGNVLRAIRVYADTAFRVTVLGEFDEPALVTRRR